MSATNQTYLPTYEELYVPPLNVTAPALKAAAVHFGKYCNKQNNVILKINFNYHLKNNVSFRFLNKI